MFVSVIVYSFFIFMHEIYQLIYIVRNYVTNNVVKNDRILQIFVMFFDTPFSIQNYSVLLLHVLLYHYFFNWILNLKYKYQNLKNALVL